MCLSDQYPTEYNIPPITDADEPPKKPSITELEIQALKYVDAVEHIANPINVFSVSKAIIKLSAHVARLRRK